MLYLNSHTPRLSFWPVTLRPKGRQGFTLIELLVVIAIIALLAAILFPVFARARENARKSSCLNNLKQISVGMAQYSQDYDELMTPLRWCYNCGIGPNPANDAMPFQALLQPYVKSVQIFKCPSVTSNANMFGTPYAPENIPAIPVSYIANAGQEANGAGSTGPGGRRPMISLSSGTVSIADIQRVASTIAIVEHRNRQYSDLYDTGAVYGSSTSRLMDHLGGSNMLFVDGHVKSMKPTATTGSLCMWTNNNANDNAATSPGTCSTAWNTALANAERAMQ